MSRTLTILGFSIPVSAPYAEGHTLTEAEAEALNQTRTENISNQLRDTVRAMKAGEGDYAGLSEDEIAAKVEALVKERDASYQFGIRAAGTPRETDPVKKEARSIAREFVNADLKSRGVKVKDVAKEDMDAAIARVMAHPKVVAEAQKRVKARGKLDLGDLFQTSTEGSEPAPAEG